ncbi:MAG: hypothetical protein ABFD54_05980 [Armatimonadota bacterium]|nr:hypothetical protein [bacterium]
MNVTKVIRGTGTIYCHAGGRYEGELPPDYGSYAVYVGPCGCGIVLAGFAEMSLRFIYPGSGDGVIDLQGIFYNNQAQIDTFTTDDIPQPPIPTVDENGWAPPFSWSCTAQVEMTLTLNMTRAIQQLGAAEQKTDFHRAYTDDWAPYDRTPAVIGPVYTLLSATVTAHVTCGSFEWDRSYEFDLDDVPWQLYRYGLKAGWQLGGSGENPYGFFDNMSVFSCGLSGMPGTTSKTLTSGSSTLSYGGGSVQFICNGSGAWTGSLLVTKGAYSAGYGGTIKNIDGTVPNVAASVKSIDGATGDADANGEFDISHQYEGYYQAYIERWDNGNRSLETDNVNDVGQTFSPADDCEMIVMNAWINNCREMGEPEFPWNMDEGEQYPNTDGEHDYPDSFYGASDRRLTMKTGLDELTEALTITVPTSKNIIEQFEGQGWEVESGAATITNTDDGIRVVVTEAPCRIKKSHDVTLAGGRYADVLFTTDKTNDKDKIDVYLATRQFQISPDDYEIDLIAPADIDIPAVDTSQTAWTGSPSWGWGIQAVGDIEFGNLQADRIYIFKSLTLKRKNPFYVLVDGGTCTRTTGMSTGASNLGGPYALEGDPNSTYYSRTAMIIVDGIVAAEIMGMTHYTGDMGNWQHVPEALSATSRYYPNDGLVEFTVAEGAENIPIIYLKRGHYASETGSDSISLSTQAQASKYAYPFNEGSPPAGSIEKTLRARLLLRVISRAGDEVGTIKLRKRDIPGGEVLSEQYLIANESGLFTAALQCHTTKQAEITSVTDSTHFIVSGLDKDYTGYTVYLLSGAGGTEYYGYPQSNVIAAHNTNTGEITLANSLTGPQPDAGQAIWVHLGYQYDLEFPDGSLLCDIEGNLLADHGTGALLAGGIIGEAIVAPRNTTYITALVS